jgi:hypothetical protein
MYIQFSFPTQISEYGVIQMAITTFSKFWVLMWDFLVLLFRIIGPCDLWLLWNYLTCFLFLLYMHTSLFDWTSLLDWWHQVIVSSYSVWCFMFSLGNYLHSLALYFVQNYLLTTQSLFWVLLDDSNVRYGGHAELLVFSY